MTSEVFRMKYHDISNCPRKPQNSPRKLIDGGFFFFKISPHKNKSILTLDSKEVLIDIERQIII